MTGIRLATAAALLATAAFADETEGMATHFLGVGYPYGACGVPDSIAAWEGAIDTLTGQGNPFDYVALNVFDTPNDYASKSHPLTGSDTAYLGLYNNGRNCGRWIRFELGDTCDGTNDGAQNQEFCRGGTGWHPNEYTGSGGYAVVFDQCSDGNAWCRDSRGHVDLHTPILAHLRKDGELMSPLATVVLGDDGEPLADDNNPWAVYYTVARFNNPKISWEFVSAPEYQGEPRFWFSQGSKIWYMRLIVTHLPNGIHKLQQLVDGTWTDATMDGDAGQQWLLPDPSTAEVTVRLFDADDQPVLEGRTWTLGYPAACGGDCVLPATAPDSAVGEGGSVALRPAVLRAGALRAATGTAILETGTEGGSLELRDLSGRFLSRTEARSGRISLEAPRGVVAVRWRLGELRGAATLAVP